MEKHPQHFVEQYSAAKSSLLKQHKEAEAAKLPSFPSDYQNRKAVRAAWKEKRRADKSSISKRKFYEPKRLMKRIGRVTHGYFLYDQLLLRIGIPNPKWLRKDGAQR